MYRAVAFLVAAHAQEFEGTEQTGLLQTLNRGQITDNVQQTQKSASASLSHLYESAKQLLLAGATPTVVNFTQQTLEDIETLVLPAINESHILDKERIDQYQEKFSQSIEDYKTLIAQMGTVDLSLNPTVIKHGECRVKEKSLCTNCSICKVKEEEICDKANKTVCRAPTCKELQKGLPPVGPFEEIPNTNPVQYTWDGRKKAELYLQQCEEHLVLKKQCEDQKEKCEQCIAEQDAQQTLCDSEHERMTRDMCNRQHKEGADLTLLDREFDMLKKSYEGFCQTLETISVPDRKVEWRTINSVDCLLREVKDKPCDNATDVVELCGGEDETFLDLKCPPIPARPTPAPAEIVCSKKWEDKVYANFNRTITKPDGTTEMDPCFAPWPPCDCGSRTTTASPPTASATTAAVTAR